MLSNLIFTLLEATVVMSLAILFVGVLRKPLRQVAGARAAYWLWLLVPASMVAVLLPGTSHSFEGAAKVFPDLVMNTLGVTSISSAAVSGGYANLALFVWAAGGVLMSSLMVSRQRSFLRSLGELTSNPDGTQRSASVAGPILVGVWRPRVVLPSDFETRYSLEQRALVLAHEQAHRERGDVPVNAIAAGSLCLFWFNPLMYWAIGRLRFDQELACDALVLPRSQAGRRSYADALLKAQLAADSAWVSPVGCHWQSTHPLTQRIAMLKRPLPGFVRRLVGIVSALLLTAFGSYAVWAMQPEEGTHGARPAVFSAVDLERWYPPDARRDGIEGNVQIAVTLDEAGRATNTLVISETPAGHGFAAAASAAAHFFEYRNPTGQKTSLTFNVKFALQ